MAVTTCWLLLQILMSPKSTGGGGSGEVIPLTSPEDLMKNLPKAMSNMFGTGVGEGMLGDSPTFKITERI
jgi:hypothetical protein